MNLHDFGEWYKQVPRAHLDRYRGAEGKFTAWHHMFYTGPCLYTTTPTPIDGYYIQCKIYDMYVHDIYTEWHADGSPVAERKNEDGGW